MNSDARAQHEHTVYLRVQKGLGMRLGNVWYSLIPMSLNKQPGNEAMFGRAPCLLSQYILNSILNKILNCIHHCNVCRVMTFMHAASFQFNTKPSRMQLSSYLIILPMISYIGQSVLNQ